MAYTIEAINGKKNMKKMAKKHAQMAFFNLFFFFVLFLSQITNWRIKKIASSTSNVSKNGKCVFSRTFIFLFHEKKKITGPSTYEIHYAHMIKHS